MHKPRGNKIPSEGACSILKGQVMITSLREAINVASENLFKKMGIRAVIKASKHFNERLILRFQEDDLSPLEKVIEKAIEKATTPGMFKYTHPYYNITVVINKMGMNGAELVSCWHQGEADELYV